MIMVLLDLRKSYCIIVYNVVLYLWLLLLVSNRRPLFKTWIVYNNTYMQSGMQ